MIDLKQISSILFVSLALALLFAGNCNAEPVKANKPSVTTSSSSAANAKEVKTAQVTANDAKSPAQRSASGQQSSINPMASKADAGSKVEKGKLKAGNTTVKTKSRSSFSHSSFVPPPPPVVPTLSGSSMIPTVVVGGELIEYLNGADLRDLQSKTTRELNKARTNLESQKELLAEKQKRALSFDSLYAEGVVSRRELQNCKKEAAEAESDLEESKILVQELEQKSDRIEARVKTLAKTKIVTGSKSGKRSP